MRSQRGLFLTCIACAAAAAMFLSASATAQGAPTVSGTWSCCGAGGAGAQTWVITESGGSLSGSFDAGPISGSVSGTSVEIITGPYTYLPSYTATFIGTISSDGETMSGTWTSNAKQSGTWTATRTAGSPTKTGSEEEEKEAAKRAEETKKVEETKKAEEAKKKAEETKKAEEERSGKHPTATMVSCYYEFLTSQDMCTAQVADASAQSATTPTGTVKFAVSGSGGFPNGATCTLVASPEAPIVPSCSVVLRTASSELPALTATYLGDATHAGSEGKTQFLGSVIETPTTKLLGGGPGQYPGEVSLEPTVPSSKTELEATLAWQLGFWQIPPPADSPLGKAFAGIPRLNEESYWYADYKTLRTELEAIPYSNTQTQDWLKWNARFEALWNTEAKIVKANEASGDVPSLVTGGRKNLAYLETVLRSANEVFKVTTTIYEDPQHGSSPAKGSVAVAARRRAKPTATVHRLAFVLIRSAKKGKVKLHLRINRRQLRRIVGKRKEITVTVWVRMLPPASVDPSRVPLIETKKLKLKG